MDVTAGAAATNLQSPSADGNAGQSRDLASLSIAADVDWDELNKCLSSDIGFRVDLDCANVWFVVQGLERGLVEGGCMRHGKGTCVWCDEVMYEGAKKDDDACVQHTQFNAHMRISRRIGNSTSIELLWLLAQRVGCNACDGRSMAVRLHVGMGSTLSAHRQRAGVLKRILNFLDCNVIRQNEVYEGEFLAGNRCGHGLCFKEDGSLYVQLLLLCCCFCAAAAAAAAADVHPAATLASGMHRPPMVLAA
jgi:hypothetical protein